VYAVLNRVFAQTLNFEIGAIYKRSDDLNLVVWNPAGREIFARKFDE
jgi:hypothetical protein